jgi:hypothetical protein
MKPFRLFWLVLFGAAAVRAQAPTPVPGSDYAPEELDQLLGPIALYPDPLVALILPAATVPSDIVLASRYLGAGGDPGQIDSQPWDDSVRALARYPAVIQWLDANLEWTRTVGEAFLQQPADVMKSIQQLRAQALAAGTLAGTPQQDIENEGGDILIEPAQPDEIYVPEYDPDAVYDPPAGYDGPFVTFSAGYPVGDWLDYECDWDDFGVWVGVWQPEWHYTRGWLRPAGGGGAGHAWRPAPGSSRKRMHPNPPASAYPRPRPMAGSPSLPHPAGAGLSAPAPRQASLPDVRGWNDSSAPAPAAKPANRGVPAAQGELFGGYNRGSVARDYSSRGEASRQAPVSAPSRPAPAPSRPVPSAPRGGERR